MQKQKRHKKQQKTKKTNWLVRIYKFFVPEDFGAEIMKGRMLGNQLRQGRISPKVVPSWWIGKGIRKLIDPERKMKVGKKK